MSPPTPNLNLINEIEKGYPITLYAKNVPEIQDKIVSWKNDADGKIRIGLGTDMQHSHGDSLVFIQRHLNFFYARSNIKFIMPYNALTVSFSVTPFKVGKTANEFVQKEKPMPEDAYFTFQMLSRNVQATYYNEDGNQFLAGYCYYLNPHGETELNVNVKVDEKAMNEAMWCWEQFPLANRYESSLFRKDRIYARFCKSAGKRVSVKATEGRQPQHRVFNWRKWHMEMHDCQECREEAQCYVPPKKVEKKKEVVVTAAATVTPKKEVARVANEKPVTEKTVTPKVDKKEEPKAEKPVEKAPIPVVSPVKEVVAKPVSVETAVAKVVEKLEDLEVEDSTEGELDTSDDEDLSIISGSSDSC